MNDFWVCSPAVSAEHEKPGGLWTCKCEAELRSMAGAVLRNTQLVGKRLELHNTSMRKVTLGLEFCLFVCLYIFI